MAFFSSHKKKNGDRKFRGSIGTVTFMRNASGVVDSLSVNQDRVWDLRFTKK